MRISVAGALQPLQPARTLGLGSSSVYSTLRAMEGRCTARDHPHEREHRAGRPSGTCCRRGAHGEVGRSSAADVSAAPLWRCGLTQRDTRRALNVAYVQHLAARESVPARPRWVICVHARSSLPTQVQQRQDLEISAGGSLLTHVCQPWARAASRPTRPRATPAAALQMTTLSRSSGLSRTAWCAAPCGMEHAPRAAELESPRLQSSPHAAQRGRPHLVLESSPPSVERWRVSPWRTRRRT